MKCEHLTGYWINRPTNFRCYECQCQFHIGDNLPANHPTKGIEFWEADEPEGYGREAELRDEGKSEAEVTATLEAEGF